MTCVNSSPIALAGLLDLVETALATVSRRLPVHVVRDDLASAGKVALVTALAQVAGSEDEVRAYCFVRVRGAMLDELRRLDPHSRASRDVITTVVRLQATLSQRLGREATTAEIATEAQLPAGRVAAALAARKAETEPDDVPWDAVPDTVNPSPLETVERIDLRSGLHAALGRLPANQSLALRLYYLEDATLDDIASRLGVSRERARQVRDAAEKRLRADFVVLSLWQSVIQNR